MSSKGFSKRLYTSFGDFWQDLWLILSNLSTLRVAMRGDLISAQFRERLMLMVTQVNGCRYCSYYHAREALKAGITKDELNALLAGEIPVDVPEDETPALLYAQHWSETDAHPDPSVRKKIVAKYGERKTDAIEMVLRMIRVGNLSGNFWDYFLFRVSFSRLGIE
jgi:AhpD family alkylhydroperoxidase